MALEHKLLHILTNVHRNEVMTKKFQKKKTLIHKLHFLMKKYTFTLYRQC